MRWVIVRGSNLIVGVVKGPESLLGETDDVGPLSVVEGGLQLQIDAALQLRPIPGHGDASDRMAGQNWLWRGTVHRRCSGS